MKQKQITETKRSQHRYWPAAAIQIGLFGLLSACGAGSSSEPAVGAASEAPVVGPSASAAQLANDANYSVSFAQAVVAGIEAAPQKTSSASITLTATESAGAIPTADSANAAVVIAAERNNASDSQDEQAATAGSSENTSTASEVPVTGTTSSGNSTDQTVSEVSGSVPATTDSEPEATESVSLPTISDLAPTGSEEEPTDSEPGTTGSENATTDSETITSGSENATTDSETITTDSENVTTDSETITTDSENVTTESETITTDSENVTTDSETITASSDNSSTDSGSVITDAEIPLTDTEIPPSDTQPPATDSTPPTTTDEPEPEPSTSPSTDNETTEHDGLSPETLFYSSTTPGFNGEVLSDSVRVTWPVDPNARGYNVYRQAQYVTSVFTEEYIDENVYDSDYYYEIQAFDNSDTLYYVATGLTVKPRSFGTTDPDAPVPNTQLLDGYNLVFSDEFTDLTLDSTKWNTAYLWGTDIIINSEEQYYVDILNEPDFGFNPFTFDGENITINSIKTPSELSEKSLNQPYLSGVITSYDAFKFTYGYAETRAKVTFGRGYWPAFWLLNAYYVDDMPEIDIMEFIGHNQDVVYHTYHYFDSEGNLRSTPSKPSPGIDYTSEFHTYAVEWKPGTIIFYINNIEVHRVVDPKVSQQEMYVIANTALGGWWAGSPDNTTPFPGEFVIDYIRVYQKSEPYDEILYSDEPSQVPRADQIFGTSSPNRRPSKEDWPEGYPSGQ